MGSVSFDVSDINTLAASFDRGSKTIGQLAQVVVRKTAVDVTADAKALAPVDTGNERSSIGWSDLRTVGQSGVLEVEVGPTANYGVFLELGTSKMAPRAHLGPALDRRTPAFVQAMEQVAERAANG